MSGFCDVVEQGFLRQALKGVAYADLTPVKVSLHSDDPGNTGANEVVGGSYSRIEVAIDKWTEPVAIGSGSASYNVDDLPFTLMPDVTVKFAGVWSSDGSVFMMSGELDSGGSHVSAGATFTVLAGRLRVRLN